MSCSNSCLQGSVCVPSGPATTLRSSDLICPHNISLPSTCPHNISLLQPTGGDTTPPSCCLPDSYVASCWLFHLGQPAPNVTGISVPNCVQPCECQPPCC